METIITDIATKRARGEIRRRDLRTGIPFATLLNDLSKDLKAIARPATSTTVELEFGYSYLGHIAADNGYEPIRSLDGTDWYSTLVEAQSAMASDGRWKSQLFLISRPKPQGAQRVELPLGYSVR